MHVSHRSRKPLSAAARGGDGYTLPRRAPASLTPHHPVKGAGARLTVYRDGRERGRVSNGCGVRASNPPPPRRARNPGLITLHDGAGVSTLPHVIVLVDRRTGRFVARQPRYALD